jgi:hypothetical protein
MRHIFLCLFLCLLSHLSLQLCELSIKFCEFQSFLLLSLLFYLHDRVTILQRQLFELTQEFILILTVEFLCELLVQSVTVLLLIR